MDTSRRDMQDVVFVEADDAPLAHDGSADGADDLETQWTRRTARWSRPVRQWWPLAAGLALVVVASSTMLAARREDARLAALAEVPGMLTALEGPVAELWRNDDGPLLGLVAFGGSLVGAQELGDGSVDVFALDPDTGRDVWRTQAREPGAANQGTRCALPVPPVPTQADTSARTVACVVIDETATTLETALGTSTYPTAARLVVLDATTGSIRSDRSIDPTSTLSEFGTDLVLSHVGAAGHLVVSRTDGSGARIRWTWTSPDPVGVDAFGQPSGGAYTVGPTVVAIASSSLAGPDGTPDDGTDGLNLTWILDADGAVTNTLVPDPATGQDGWIQPLRDGKLLAVPTSREGGQSSTRIIDRTTGRSFTAQAYPNVSAPDDGSLDQLVLMLGPQSNGLVAYELATGRLAWTGEPGSNTSGTLIIDGRILSADFGSLRSIDGRTGTTVWTTTITAEWASLMTDGRLVLVSQAALGGSSTLAAYGLDDGRPRWQIDLPGIYSLGAIDGRLFGWSDLGLVALG